VAGAGLQVRKRLGVGMGKDGGVAKRALVGAKAALRSRGSGRILGVVGGGVAMPILEITRWREKEALYVWIVRAGWGGE
jgi:hypothetical protein